MLEGIDYCSPHMAYPYVAAVLDNGVDMSDRPVLTTVHTLYTDLLDKVYVGSEKPP